MTIELLKQRIEAHKQERTRLIGNISAYDGAIQEAQYWLSVLEAQAAATVPPVEPKKAKNA